MAGGGEAGELDEDKLDKGTDPIFRQLRPADGFCSCRSFPTAHIGAG